MSSSCIIDHQRLPASSAPFSGFHDTALLNFPLVSLLCVIAASQNYLSKCSWPPIQNVYSCPRSLLHASSYNYYLYLYVSNAYLQPWPILGSPAPSIPLCTHMCPFLPLWGSKLNSWSLPSSSVCSFFFPFLQDRHHHLQSCPPQILGSIVYTTLLLMHLLNPFTAPYILPQPWPKHPCTLPGLSPEFPNWAPCTLSILYAVTELSLIFTCFHFLMTFHEL